MVKYNISTSCFLNLTLLKDGKSIGITWQEVKRGKRITKLTITIWKDEEITKKSKYQYKLQALKKKAAWKDIVAAPILVNDIKVVKRKRQ